MDHAGPEDPSNHVPEDPSNRVPERPSNRVPEDPSNRVPEDPTVSYVAKDYLCIVDRVNCSLQKIKSELVSM